MACPTCALSPLLALFCDRSFALGPSACALSTSILRAFLLFHLPSAQPISAVERFLLHHSRDHLLTNSNLLKFSGHAALFSSPPRLFLFPLPWSFPGFFATLAAPGSRLSDLKPFPRVLFPSHPLVNPVHWFNVYFRSVKYGSPFPPSPKGHHPPLIRLHPLRVWLPVVF